MNKNPKAMKQYLADRTARAGAELRELTGTDTVLLPVTGEPKLYVAVGTLAGIAQVAGKSFDEAAGNTNKAVLTDEQIEQMWETAALHARAGEIKYYFAGLVHAAVLANASNAVVAEPGKLGEPVPEHILEAIREYGDLRADGKASSTVQMANIILAMRRHYRAAPAPADNPSTAGAAKGGIAIDVKHEFEMWASNRGESAVYIGDGLYQSSSITDQAEAFAAGVALGRAAPALNPSDMRDQALEEAALAVQSMGDVNPPMSFGIRCAAAIRALKGAAAQSVEGGEDA